MKKFRAALLPVTLALLLATASGCGRAVETEAESVKSSYAAVLSMETTPVIDYVVPESLPNILVDEEGYCLGGQMQAVLKGKHLPEVFSLLDAQSGETVLSGEVEKLTYNEELDIYTGYADFGSISKVGEYYIKCDIIGESDRFTVEENLYERLFLERYDSLMEKCKGRTLTLSEAVALLESYEWYPDIFPDEDGDEVPDMLEELKSWVAYCEENGVEEDEEALYAAFLAKFSYFCQKSDYSYATDCLKRASTVLGQVQTALGKDADGFFALTELYRATGRSTYRNQIADYTSFFQNNSSYLEEQTYLYGAMTYLATRQSVDVDLCDTFMSNLMDRAEEISNRYSEMIHPVTAKNNGSADLLKNAMLVSCENYCLHSYQYTNICEDFLHYLMGRNRDSVNFYENDADSVEYLLLLAGLAAE